MSAWALLLLVASPMEIGAWEVPAGCSSKAAFVAKVEAEIGASSDTDAPPVLEADVRVEEVAPAHRQLQLRSCLDGQDHTRAFDVTSCDAVVGPPSWSSRCGGCSGGRARLLLARLGAVCGEKIASQETRSRETNAR